MTRTIVVNTIAYQQVLQKNPCQAGLIPEIKSMGIDYVEIRREFITNGNMELEEITAAAKEEQVKLFYSVPDEVFVNSEVNPRLENYFKEAALLNAQQMKLTLGNLDELTLQRAGQLGEILHNYQTKLTIENDQSKERGSASRLKVFMEEAAKYGLTLGVTFDVANFVYFAETPVESAKILRPFVHYIHIKNVKRNGENLEVTDMGSGELDIKSILTEFPASVPCAIEYSCGDAPAIQQKIMADKREIQSWVSNPS